jgi:CheY-like chemotaxis protein
MKNHDSADRHVLLLDPHPSTAYPLSAALEWHGYRVMLAANAWSAVALACHQQPDVAVLDLTDPRSEGWQAMERLLSIFPALPCIVRVTDSAGAGHALALGAAQCLLLPFHPRHLLAMVDAVLAQEAAILVKHRAAFPPPHFTVPALHTNAA